MGESFVNNSFYSTNKVMITENQSGSKKIVLKAVFLLFKIGQSIVHESNFL